MEDKKLPQEIAIQEDPPREVTEPLEPAEGISTDEIETKVDKEVTLKESQLQGILAEIEKLKKANQPFQRAKRVKEHTATARYYEDKPVVWYGDVREESMEGKKVSIMNIKLLGESKKYPVEYLDFLNQRGDYENNMVKVKIVKQEAEKIIESQGIKRAENPDPAKISTSSFDSVEVELEVTSVEYTATVEVLEGPHQGETFKIPTKALNA